MLWWSSLQDSMPQPVVATHWLFPAATHPASALIPSITDGLNLPVSPSFNLKPAIFSLKVSSTGVDRSGSVHKKCQIHSKLGLSLDNHLTAKS